MTESGWATVPAPGSRVLITGAAGGLGRALSAAVTEVGVVGPVLFLLSPAGGYLTGQALRLDGGADLGQAGLHR